ncbi:EAL domain-containing protein [Rheinheimera sp.]|uniref:bifunctional diguanylate cyclase/phosphodiesterase n=1 Tax=Rheinheimera sp. TaxID=1869214 RepID=UPI002736EF9D|nr:EAL domain-containing protein [Rheinheimera sp.]MDP2715741.1 EAL domain-containing protein [Rheinheimera sp.]
MLKKGISLSTQFYALIIVMTFVAFAGSLLSSTLTLRDYLNSQLGSHAQDAAHNLGLAISSSGGADKVLIQTLASTLFDSGYYQQIRFVDNEERELVNLSHDNNAAVPRWFSDVFALQAPIMQSEISDGWLVLGTLTVQSNTVLAERSLWQQTTRNLLSSALLFALAALVIHVILRALLKPLRQIVQQAEAVSRKEFRQNPTRTATRELNLVLGALNSMVLNISKVFSEQSRYAEQLMQQAFLDPLTGLPNRRALQQQLSNLQQDAQINHNALYVAMITLSSLQQTNDEQGYASGDEYVQKAAALLQQLKQQYPGLQLFRLSGSEFAIIGAADKAGAAELDNKLTLALEQEHSQSYNQGFGRAVSVLAQAAEPFSNILARLDTLQAQDSVQLLSGSTATEADLCAPGRLQWQQLIDRLLHHNDSSDANMELLLQPVADQQHKLLYAECLLRFVVDDKPLSTAEVLAMAARLNRADTLERQMLQFILHSLPQLAGGAVAINISEAVLCSDDLRQWLLLQLTQRSTQLPPLLVEIAEHSILQHPQQAAEFITKLQQLNIKVVIERFGANLTSLRHIQHLNIDYVKLDAGFSSDLEQESSRFFIMTLTQICHSVGIKVLATHLESIDSLNACKLLNIDGFQGFVLGEIINFTFLSKKEDVNKTKMQYTLKQVFNPKGDTYDAS